MWNVKHQGSAGHTVRQRKPSRIVWLARQLFETHGLFARICRMSAKRGMTGEAVSTVEPPDKTYSISSTEIGFAYKKSCMTLHPSASRKSLCSCVSTAFATTPKPSFSARPEMALIIASSCASCPMSRTKERSILSVQMGNCLRWLSDE